MKFKYVNLRAVHKLIGTNYPFGANSLCESLEEYLVYVVETGDQMPETLLRHNASGKRNAAIGEMLGLDVDVSFEVDIKTNKILRQLKDYRVNTQFARLKEDRRVVLHIHLKYAEPRTQWSISVPLQALMKGFGDPEEGYQCYAHSISRINPETSLPFDQNFYCGITSRNWLARMGEHFNEVRKGSNKLFHRAWREYQGRSDVILSSELIILNQSYEDAMNWEEWIVDRYMNEKKTLNMIPGGFKGIKLLHKFGNLNRVSNISIEERDAALEAYSKDHPRAGIPNLFIAGLWQDDEFYAKVIQQRKGTLSREQVRQIRYLNTLGWSPDAIAKEMDILKVSQVERVINGRTYTRMH